jgi:alpha-tubulin suppressor-like RCC1 family protein
VYYGGKLGNGTDGEREHAEQGTPVPVSPTLGPGGPNLTGIKAIAAGGDTRLAVTQEGKVFGWGLDYSGMLGTAASGVHTLYPVEIQGVSNVVEVALEDTPSSWSRNRTGKQKFSRSGATRRASSATQASQNRRPRPFPS